MTSSRPSAGATHSGVELGVEARLWQGLLSDRDRIVLGQTYTYGRFRFDGYATYNDAQIPGLPEHTARAELRWEHPDGWYGGPVLAYQDGWPVDFAGTLEADRSFLLGARAGYQPINGFAAFIEGRNLLDDTYAATSSIADPTTSAATPAVQSRRRPGGLRRRRVASLSCR